MASVPPLLFQRAYRLVVDNIEIKTTPGVPPLSIKFSVKKNLKPEPNKAEIKIWNLTVSHRQHLSELGVVPVSLEAGYEAAGTSLLFLGNLRSAFTTREGPDLVTTISSGDKSSAMRTARTSRSFKRGQADLGTVLRLLATDLGVTPGNLDDAVAQLSKTPAKTMFDKAFVLSGSASRELTAILRSFNYRWSVQDGALQILPLKAPLNKVAIQCDAEHGMVGTPTVDNKGVLHVTMLLAPSLAPGKLINLTSLYYNSGGYRIEECEYEGESFGKEWYAKLKCQKY